MIAVIFSGDIKYPFSSIIVWRSASGSLEKAMQFLRLQISDNSEMLSFDVGFGILKLKSGETLSLNQWISPILADVMALQISIELPHFGSMTNSFEKSFITVKSVVLFIFIPLMNFQYQKIRDSLPNENL